MSNLPQRDDQVRELKRGQFSLRALLLLLTATAGALSLGAVLPEYRFLALFFVFALAVRLLFGGRKINDSPPGLASTLGSLLLRVVAGVVGLINGGVFGVFLFIPLAIGLDLLGVQLDLLTFVITFMILGMVVGVIRPSVFRYVIWLP